MAALVFRIVPPGLYSGGARAVVERAFMVSRRAWVIPLSGFFEPVFYLATIGVGLDHLLGERFGPGGYAGYIAPGLLAASAMNGAVYDATFNIFFKLKYNKLYDGMLATSLGPMDVAIGEITWALVRGGLYSLGFLLVMAGMGLVASPWGLLALPAALLVSLAFAALGMACTTFLRTWQDFGYVHLAIVPMFLCATTFYPLSTYPEPLRSIVQALPLYHAIALIRGLTSGSVGPSLLAHVLYFIVMAGVGIVVASRRLAGLLLR